MSSAPSAFLRTLAKAELHLHLEGSIEPSTLLELKRRHGQHAIPEEVDRLYQFQDFTGFLMAFKGITENLQSPEDYELITYRLMERLKTENVLHAEVFVSVGVCLWRVQDFPLIFEALDRARLRGEKDFGVSLLWIFDAVRQFGAEKAQEVVDLAIQFRDRNVAGFGIGGDELQVPTAEFRGVYDRASELGFHRLMHAGEVGGPEKIREAIELLRVERIGHGIAAIQDPSLMDLLAERKIPLELCPQSNLRTGALARQLARHPVQIEDHPLPVFFRHEIPVVLSTDDPALFDTNLRSEYAHAAHMGLQESELEQTCAMGFHYAFQPSSQTGTP